MKDSELKEKMKKGWVHAIITFEIAGKPKEHVEETLAQYIENVKKDERLVFIQEEREEAIEHDDGVFSAFSECEMLVEDLETFTWLCMNFTPASIEIIEPDVMKFESRDLTNWMNDLLAKLHQISAQLRGEKGSKDHMVIGMNQLILNTLQLALQTGPKTIEELSKTTGIVGEQLKDFLNSLERKGKISAEGEKYRLA